MSAPSSSAIKPPPDLSSALMESRQRWRAIGAIAADFAFETDAAGRFTFLSPESVLGWDSSDLLGQSSSCLLSDPGAARLGGDADLFRAAALVRRRRVWLAAADGSSACYALSSDPLLDAAGHQHGTRGIGVDVSAEEEEQGRAAASLRRGQVVDRILGQMHHEVTAPRVIDTMLATVVQSMGAVGAAIFGVPTDQPITSLYGSGGETTQILAIADTFLRQDGAEVQVGHSDTGMQVLTCPIVTRFGEQAGLVVWRAAWARNWDEDDRQLAASVTGLVRIVLEHEAIQRNLARQARTDPLTGLLNRRAFLEETARRIDRLDREDLPGTVLCIDIDGFLAHNAQLGHDACDMILVRMAGLLRRTFRPTDLLARLGGDEFAVWLDSSDELTAAERAEGLRLAFPRDVAELAGSEFPASLCIGIACRQPGTHEELDSILRRATHALRDAKRCGRGQWRVSHEKVAR